MNDLAIRLDNIGKQYRIGHVRDTERTLRETLVDAVASPFRRAATLLSRRRPAGGGSDDTIWALKGVSCEINRGEVVAIIGRNGAGKSTLLKVLSRITEPTVGSAELYGRVGSLLEVGTGFHSELTGRENIYLNGAILGMRKREIERKFDQIVAFSEVEKFIDTPVKHFSSGMYLRLAFAVAAHLDPEILLVDEVLAVGDAAFQQKCLGKMEDVAQMGRTVLFVSHNLAAVEHLCHKGIVLQDGGLVFNGSAREAIRYYLHEAGTHLTARPHIVDLTTVARRQDHRPLLRRMELFTANRQPVTSGLRIGAPLTVFVRFTLENPTESFNVGLGFDDLMGTRIFTAHSLFQPNLANGTRVGEQTMICEIPSLTLVPGEYRIRVTLDLGTVSVDQIDDATRLTIIDSDYYGTGKVPWNGTFVLAHNWRLAAGDSRGA